MLGRGGSDLRADTELNSISLEQEDVEDVQVSDPGAVAAVRVGTGTDGKGGA
ncbi:hypothetical protein D3C76_1825380 [compost metagenome]